MISFNSTMTANTNENNAPKSTPIASISFFLVAIGGLKPPTLTYETCLLPVTTHLLKPDNFTKLIII